MKSKSKKIALLAVFFIAGTIFGIIIKGSFSSASTQFGIWVKSNSTAVKDSITSFKDLITAFAFLIGGWWTYTRYIRQRLDSPRASIDLSIDYQIISDTQVLVHVAAKVTNTGSVLICLQDAKTIVNRVLPLEKDSQPEIDKDNNVVTSWPPVARKIWFYKPGEIEIEPGECELLDSSFIIDSPIKTIEIYTWVQNSSKKDKKIGWCVSKYYDISTDNKTDFTKQEVIYVQGSKTCSPTSTCSPKA